MKQVLITGSEGGIGIALVKAFTDAGYQVIGLDTAEQSKSSLQGYVQADLSRFAGDPGFRRAVCDKIRSALRGAPLAALVNNAATQILGKFESLSDEDWQSTLNTNVLAPMFLIRELLAELSESRGTVVNIASVHATLTKPGFSAYATSKTALLGLTRALAVEVGDRIQVTAICPAAIATPMLMAGFSGRGGDYKQLKEFHPCKDVGQPEDVARLAVSMVEGATPFYNGMVINLDGGVGSRLHDPI